MTPIETRHPSNAVAMRFDALDTDHEAAGCPECGCALVDGAPCNCARQHLPAERLRPNLADVLDGDLVALQASALWRLQVRGEVIA
jgi:hypothetical protein